MQLERKYKVSVCVSTYNHEKYIAQCLQSIVNQKTTFPFEVIVGEDCSTDETRAIVREFSIKFPKIIKPIYHEVNVGGMQNYYDVHKAARGDYIAHIDGDDYALPGKLQIQADALDNDHSLNIIWHRMELFNDKGMRKPIPRDGAPFVNSRITMYDLFLYGPFGPHSSTMYRRKCLVAQESSADILDWQLSIEIIGRGNGVMLPNILGGYRVHSGGWSTGAKANSNTRTLLCNAQIDFMRRFPKCKSTIALRAMFVALFDLINRNTFFTKSIVVLIKSRSFPDFSKAWKLVQFYRYSKLPPEFR